MSSSLSPRSIRRPLIALAVMFGATLFLSTASAQKLSYPKTKKVTHTDDYFGTVVADPYRWLEDDHSPETAQWTAEENHLTNDYLEKIPYRTQVKARLKQRVNYIRYSRPFKHGKYIFFYMNTGLQNQSVLYIQNGLKGKPEVLIDPNTLSADGTTRLTAFELSRSARYAAYGISRAGSDWEEFHVMEIATKKVLPDTLKWVKFSGIAWQGDGFYYSRFDEPAKGKELTASNENQKVYYHKVGDMQDKDTLVYADAAHPKRFNGVGTTEDERFLILYVSDPMSGKRGNALSYRDLSRGDKEFKPIIDVITDDQYGIVDNLGEKFLIQTNRNAPNGKVDLFDPKKPEFKDWKEVIPEKPEPLQSAGTAGGKLFVTYLKDVTTRAYVYSLDGKLENEAALPALGTAGGFGGRKEDKYVFYTFTSFTFPPTIYRYDIADRKTTLFRAPEIPDFKPEDYETEQVFYPSKDGTKIPMFLVHKKGLKQDGRNPTLLYGYGGFNITLEPSFSSINLALLEQGFVYASANLRGGGEYGEKWHEAGTKLHKQNVFDDFVAAAQYLISNNYTSPEHLAIQGGSNGGLLVGAVLNQHPELFKAAIAEVGVMDMLRFQKFTAGSAWIPDYGSSDNKEQFQYIYRYSPLQNIREDVKYPATLITTADHDDRVVPAHSFKYAATLQEKQTGDNPILIRIDTNAGHGGSNLSKALDEITDIYSFLFYNLGVTPIY